MPERQDSRAPGAVNPPTAFEQFAGVTPAPLQVVPNRSLGAIELRIDRTPVVMLAPVLVERLIWSLIEALADLEVEP